MVGIRRELTPLAAAGLVVIMVGATLTTLAIGGGVLALPTVVIGLLAASVAHCRRQLLPHLGTTHARRLQAAT